MNIRTKVLAVAAGMVVAGGLGFGVGTVEAQQPHMQNALGYLTSAQSELQVAEANKGGHRVNALNLVNQAITQVQAGIAVGAGY